MEDKLKILCIDGDQDTLDFTQVILSKEYETRATLNGTDGIQEAKSWLPDVILLDINMPELDGVETCKQLKDASETTHIPVIFFSNKNSTDNYLSVLEAGGEDFISKPLEPENLLTKIRVLLNYKNQHSALENQISDANKTALIAMTSSNELGLALALVEKSYGIGDYQSLAALLFSFTERLQLSCSLLIKTNEEDLCFSSAGDISPLETRVLIKLRAKDRFYDSGCRTNINYLNTSLLIKNMPLENMEQYGRIKDLLPPILGAFDAKVRSLNLVRAIEQQSVELNTSFTNIKDTLQNLGASLQQNAKGGNLILSAMLHDLIQSLPSMALEPDQEAYILDRIEFSITSTTEITDAGDSMAASFDEVIDQLQSLVEKQNKLAEASASQYDAENSDNSDSGDGDDIELF